MLLQQMSWGNTAHFFLACDSSVMLCKMNKIPWNSSSRSIWEHYTAQTGAGHEVTWQECSGYSLFGSVYHTMHWGCHAVCCKKQGPYTNGFKELALLARVVSGLWQVCSQTWHDCQWLMTPNGCERSLAKSMLESSSSSTSPTTALPNTDTYQT